MRADPGAPGTKGCPTCATPNPAHANFCLECGVHLTWTAAERRIITVLFADLSGFTGLTEQLDAERVHSLITIWLDPLCEAVVRWGGHVDKFIGDCVMALFGAPVAYENEPERAVRAALDMHAAFNEQGIIDHAAEIGIAGYRPRLSIGVNTGPVVTGMFSSGGAWDYTAIGDTVNVAARLQGLCEPGGILVGDPTWQQTRHLFEFGEERVLQVKGRHQPVRARPVTGIREVRGRVRGFADIETPLIGRQADLARLRARWREAAAGAWRSCLLLGAAGIGKSRMVAELAAAEGLDGGALARGRSYPYASSTPWEPIAELIRDLHDVGVELSAPEAVAAIAGRAPDPTLPWSEDERAGLGAVLGSPASDIQRLEELPPAERQERMTGAVLRALREGVRGPTLLVLEDLHWADRTTLDFLRSLPSEALPGPALLVLVSRPPLPTERNVMELVEACADPIRLAPLDRAQTMKLIASILGPHQLADDLISKVYERSGGNPLFIEEIIKALIAGGVIVREGEAWRSPPEADAFQIPDSIESVISTRIDALPPSAKKVLQYAAIVGRRFWPGVLGEALANRPVDEELDDLIQAALVRTQPDSAVMGETEYAFEHLLLQEVAYAELLTGVRSELHGTVADWIERHLARDVAEYDDWVGYHLERSSTPSRALPYLERATARAWDRGALRDAEGLIERALVVAEEAEDRIRLARLADDVAAAVGDDERRLEAIERLAALAEENGDPATIAEAAFRRARRLVDVGELEAAASLAHTAVAPFRERGDESSEADVLTLLGRVAHLRGGYEEALGHYRAALPLERRAGDRLGEADILHRLGLAEVDFGNFTRALEHFDQSLGIYAEAGHRPGQALVLADRAAAFRWLGRHAEAEATARRAEDVAAACGSRSALAAASFARATAIGAAGRAGEARQLLRDLLKTTGELRRPILEAHVWLALGELAIGEEAAEAVRRAREVASRSGLIHVEVLGLTRLAQIALQAGDLAEADRDSGRAIELLERYGDIQGPDELVYYTRSRVLAALGRDDEAVVARERARDVVLRSAAWIEDEELRRSYLENVPPNPEILAPESAP